MEKTFISKNTEETIQSGVEFASSLNPQDVVFLIGNLGSGKTTFAQGIAKGLGVDSRVISPTFVVVRTHEIKSPKSEDIGQRIERLYHLDLYRLNDEKEVKGIDLSDYLEDPTGVVVIEWPEIGQNLVNKKVWTVIFENLENDERKITISYA